MTILPLYIALFRLLWVKGYYALWVKISHCISGFVLVTVDFYTVQFTVLSIVIYLYIVQSGIDIVHLVYWKIKN